MYVIELSSFSKVSETAMCGCIDCASIRHWCGYGILCHKS